MQRIDLKQSNGDSFVFRDGSYIALRFAFKQGKARRIVWDSVAVDANGGAKSADINAADIAREVKAGRAVRIKSGNESPESPESFKAALEYLASVKSVKQENTRFYAVF